MDISPLPPPAPRKPGARRKLTYDDTRLSVPDVFRLLGLPTHPIHTQPAGRAASKAWEDEYGVSPRFDRRPKTGGGCGGGSHHMATYPLEWRGRLEAIVRGIAQPKELPAPEPQGLLTFTPFTPFQPVELPDLRVGLSALHQSPRMGFVVDVPDEDQAAFRDDFIQASAERVMELEHVHHEPLPEPLPEGRLRRLFRSWGRMVAGEVRK